MHGQAMGDRKCDCTKRAQQIVARAIAIYGPSTMFVLTKGDEVRLSSDPDTGEFSLTAPQMTVPAETLGHIQRNQHVSRTLLDAPVSAMWTEARRPGRKALVAGRFNIALDPRRCVADVHRHPDGGGFLYPADRAK